jgi:hypothetical protein
VLESSPGLVIRSDVSASRDDWSVDAAPQSAAISAEGRQTFIRHIAAGLHAPWRLAGWEFRDTGIGRNRRACWRACDRPPTTVITGHRGGAGFDALVVLSGAVTLRLLMV